MTRRKHQHRTAAAALTAVTGLAWLNWDEYLLYQLAAWHERHPNADIHHGVGYWQAQLRLGGPSNEQHIVTTARTRGAARRPGRAGVGPPGGGSHPLTFTLPVDNATHPDLAVHSEPQIGQILSQILGQFETKAQREERDGKDIQLARGCPEGECYTKRLTVLIGGVGYAPIFDQGVCLRFGQRAITAPRTWPPASTARYDRSSPVFSPARSAARARPCGQAPRSCISRTLSPAGQRKTPYAAANFPATSVLPQYGHPVLSSSRNALSAASGGRGGIFGGYSRP